MSRRHRAEKRDVIPDPKFGDVVLSKFMNSLMLNGKKSTAETIVYGAFDRIQEKSSQDPLQVFHEALDNVKPSVEVRSRRVGGATYQVPVEVRHERRQAGGTVALGRTDDRHVSGLCADRDIPRQRERRPVADSVARDEGRDATDDGAVATRGSLAAALRGLQRAGEPSTRCAR